MYVDDLDVFATLMLLDESPTVLSLGSLCDEERYSCEWKKGESPTLRSDRQVTRSRSENHVSIGAVSQEPLIHNSKPAIQRSVA